MKLLKKMQEQDTEMCSTEAVIEYRECWDMQKITCHEGGQLSICHGCHKVVNDRFILKVEPDLTWHEKCLKCCKCKVQFEAYKTCFVKDGRAYCMDDYVYNFGGTKCNGCKKIIRQKQLTRTVLTFRYHMECFKCAACERVLENGDEFAMRANNLYCKEDLEQFSETEIPATDAAEDIKFSLQFTEDLDQTISEHGSSPSTAGGTNFLSDDGSPATEESSRKSNTPNLDRDLPLVSSNSSVRSSSVAGSRSNSSTRRNIPGRVSKSEGKPARVRTVMSEKQLTMLKNCYHQNSRPDALMKEQLVELTGLSPRVIRVWFQNKRCKEKKKAHLIKQVMMENKQNPQFGYYGSMQGVRLVASPPVPNDPNMTIPHEVIGYQPPWKHLIEFGNSHDLERLDPSSPSYQHLMHQMHGSVSLYPPMDHQNLPPHLSSHELMSNHHHHPPSTDGGLQPIHHHSTTLTPYGSPMDESITNLSPPNSNSLTPISPSTQSGGMYYDTPTTRSLLTSYNSEMNSSGGES